MPRRTSSIALHSRTSLAAAQVGTMNNDLIATHGDLLKMQVSVLSALCREEASRVFSHRFDTL